MLSKSYKAKVLSVVSGDDLLLLVDLGIDGLHKEVRARLRGVDAPNAYKEGPDSDACRLRDEVRDLLSNGQVAIDLYHEGRGGWLIELWYQDKSTDTTRSINDLLQKRGFEFRAQRS